jgi:hypothetical protein
MKGCKFLDIRDDGSGGGVSSSATLRIIDCEFRSCQAGAGGAISTSAGLSILSTVVTSCQAQTAGAIECRGRNSHEVSLTSSAFDRPRAAIFGCLVSNRFGVVGASCNFSGSIATNCVGLLEVSNAPIEFRMCVVARSTAANHNGAFCLRNCDELSIERCLFANCSHVTSRYEAGGVFLIYATAYDSAITHSLFVGNDPNGSFTIHVLSGHQLMLVGCCFTGAEAREIAPRLIAKDKVLFGQAECTAVLQSRAPRPPKRRTTPAAAGPGKKVRIFVLSVAVSLTLMVLLSGVRVVVRRACGKEAPQTKAPRAFV